MRRFADIDLISNRIPNETTILTFPDLLEMPGLGELGMTMWQAGHSGMKSSLLLNQ